MVVIPTIGFLTTVIVKSCVTVLVHGAKLATLILMTTVPLSEAGIYVGVAVFAPVNEPVPLTIVQEIEAGL